MGEILYPKHFEFPVVFGGKSFNLPLSMYENKFVYFNDGSQSLLIGSKSSRPQLGMGTGLPLSHFQSYGNLGLSDFRLPLIGYGCSDLSLMFSLASLSPSELLLLNRHKYGIVLNI